MSLAATGTEGRAALPAVRAWLLCCLLFFATALSFLDRQVLGVLAPELTAEFGMSNAVYARVVFAFVLSYTVRFALGGRLMDALGTRLGLTLSVALWSAASAARSRPPRCSACCGWWAGGWRFAACQPGACRHRVAGG